MCVHDRLREREEAELLLINNYKLDTVLFPAYPSSIQASKLVCVHMPYSTDDASSHHLPPWPKPGINWKSRGSMLAIKQSWQGPS